MRNLRPALLVLLTSSLAGLGVPAGFGQTKPASKNSRTPSAARKNASGKSTASKTTAAKKPAINLPAAKSSHPSSASGKKVPAKTSGEPSGTSAKKGSSKTSKRSRKQPGQKAPTSDRVIEIQSALAKDGSFQGSPSGKWDDDTTAAMRKFQAAHGLNPSGKLDAPTLQRLGLGSQTAGVAAPTPPPGSFSRLTSSNAAPPAIESAPRQ
jgi:hypothetical protein